MGFIREFPPWSANTGDWPDLDLIKPFLCVPSRTCEEKLDVTLQLTTSKKRTALL